MRLRGKLPIFSRQDTYNLDSTLSPIIYHGLKAFKEEIERRELEELVNSIPSHQYPDVHNISDEDEENALQDWLNILDSMIYAFDIKSELDISDYNFNIEFEKAGQSKEGCTTMNVVVDNESEWQRYKDDKEAWNKKCQYGREMFGKYFNDLWI